MLLEKAKILKIWSSFSDERLDKKTLVIIEIFQRGITNDTPNILERKSVPLTWEIQLTLMIDWPNTTILYSLSTHNFREFRGRN